LLDSLGSDVTGVMFHTHLPKGMHESYQPILPRGDGAFPDVQLLPSSKELSLQLHGHHIRRRRSPALVNKQRPPSQQEASIGKHWHRVRTHLTDGDA
jgi:hypothetical protein